MERTIRVSLKSEPDCCPRSSLRGHPPLTRHTRRCDGDAPALRGRVTCTRLAEKNSFVLSHPAPAGPERERVQAPLPRRRCRRAAAQRPSDTRWRRTHYANNQPRAKRMKSRTTPRR